MCEIGITDESGAPVDDPDVSKGWVETVCKVGADGTVTTTARVWHEYTEEELAAIAEREERERVLAEAAAFFPEGRAEMEAEISEAASGSDPALATFATLAMPTVAPTARDSALAPVLKWAPDYVPEGHEYKAGEVFRTSDGGLWRVSQDFTSGWTRSSTASRWRRTASSCGRSRTAPTTRSPRATCATGRTQTGRSTGPSWRATRTARRTTRRAGSR